jgi:stage V sporulation protein B
MGVSAVAAYRLVFMIHPGNLTATGSAIIIAVIVYFVMVFLTGAVTEEELALIPKGKMIYNIAVRLHLAK